jgi:hypothetical protein
MRHPTVEGHLIADIRRAVEFLKIDVSHEESRSGISDPALSEYSLVARALSARKENLNPDDSLVMQLGQRSAARAFIFGHKSFFAPYRKQQ